MWLFVASYHFDQDYFPFLTVPLVHYSVELFGMSLFLFFYVLYNYFIFHPSIWSSCTAALINDVVEQLAFSLFTDCCHGHNNENKCKSLSAYYYWLYKKNKVCIYCVQMLINKIIENCFVLIFVSDECVCVWSSVFLHVIVCLYAPVLHNMSVYEFV